MTDEIDDRDDRGNRKDEPPQDDAARRSAQQPRRPYLEVELPESGMGGTSDAGSAGDEAAESAAYMRGLPEDKTR